MKEIKITKGQVAIVDDEDYNFLNRFNWCASKCGNSYYAVSHYHHKGKKYKHYMHRVIMMISEETIVVDHRDFDTLNNQRNNLRVCGKQQNQWNRKSNKHSSSKYLGVCLHGNKKGWMAQITKDRKHNYLGYFKTEEQAALAYNKAATELFGEFSNLNVIQ